LAWLSAASKRCSLFIHYLFCDLFIIHSVFYSLFIPCFVDGLFYGSFCRIVSGLSNYNFRRWS
jgi:hypothetical protein